MRSVLSSVVFLPPMVFVLRRARVDPFHVGIRNLDFESLAAFFGIPVVLVAVVLLLNRTTRAPNRGAVRRLCRVFGTIVLVGAAVVALSVVAWVIAVLLWDPERIPTSKAAEIGTAALYAGAVGAWLRLTGREPAPPSPVHVF